MEWDEVFGFKEFFRPPPPQLAWVDLVFVHGLNGDRELTWTAEKSGVCWPRDLLPQELAGLDVRILSYGYDANVARPDADSIDEYASSFLENLCHIRRRSGTHECPVIFVAHSLGGLVVKSALIASARYEARGDYRRSLGSLAYGILIMGMPQFTEEGAYWNTYLQNLERIIHSEADFKEQKLIGTLETDIETVISIENNFTKRIKGLRLSYFYNIKPTAAKGKKAEVIGEQFTAPGLPDVERSGSEADHFRTAKFEDSNAPGYSIVVGTIRSYAESANAVAGPALEMKSEQDKKLSFESRMNAGSIGDDFSFHRDYREDHISTVSRQPGSEPLGSFTPSPGSGKSSPSRKFSSDLPEKRYNTNFDDEDGESVSDALKRLPARLRAKEQQLRESLPTSRFGNFFNDILSRPNLASGLAASQEVENAYFQISLFIRWQVISFLTSDFEHGQDIGNIFILVGDPHSAQGITCNEYVTSRWPRFGATIMNLLKDALSQLESGFDIKKDNFACTVATEGNNLAGTLCSCSWKRHAGINEVERVHFDLKGPVSTVIEIVEILSWICASLRTSNPDYSGFSKSGIDAKIKPEFGFRGLKCFINPSRWMPGESVERQCWHVLFKNATIVDCLAVPRSFNSSRPSSALRWQGLELNFQDMIGLTMVDTVIEYEESLVLLGVSLALVPIRWTENGHLFWHVVYKEPESRRVQLWQISEDKNCRHREKFKDLNKLMTAPGNLLGLWSKAVVVLGTSQATYNNRPKHELEEMNTIDEPSSKSRVFSLNLHYAVLGRTTTTAFAKTQITMDPNKEKLSGLLQAFKSEPLLLYDSNIARAWLVPKLSVILHAAQLYARSTGFNDKIPYAEEGEDGTEAATKALRNLDFKAIKLSDFGTCESDSFTLEDLLRRITNNLIGMEASMRGRKSFTDAGEARGYSFYDLTLTMVPRLYRTKSQWLSAPPNWAPLTERVLMLMSPSIGDLVRRGAGCEGPTPFTERDQLLAQISCLAMASQNAESFYQQGRFSDKCFWISPHAPIGSCHAKGCKKHHHHIQYLGSGKKKGAWWPNAEINKSGAVIFGSKNVVRKPLSENMEHDQSARIGMPNAANGNGREMHDAEPVAAHVTSR